MADTASTTPGAEDDVFSFDTGFESVADRKYPLCPEGVQRVIVDKAVFSMKDNFQKTAKVPTITLWLSTLDAKYEDESTKEKRSFRLFETLKISDHKKSNMLDWFEKVCGGMTYVEATKPDGQKAKRIWLGPRSVEKTEEGEEIRYKVFDHIEYSVLIEHKVPEGGTEKKDRIAAIVACPEDKKAANKKLFTPAA